MNDAIIKQMVDFFQTLSPMDDEECLAADKQTKAIAIAIIEFVDRMKKNENQDFIKNKIGDLKSAITDFETFIKENIISKNERIKIEKEHDELEQKVFEINNLISKRDEIFAMDTYLLSNMHVSESSIEEDYNVTSGKIEQFVQVIQDTIEVFAPLKNDLATKVNANLKVLSGIQTETDEMLNPYLEKLNSELGDLTIFKTNKSNELIELQSNYNDLVDQLKEIKEMLLNIQETHTKNIETYELHFAQNKAIWGEMGKRHNLDEYLKVLIADTEKNLKDFDKNIKELLLKSDHINIF